jgi:hypothetical protein
VSSRAGDPRGSWFRSEKPSAAAVNGPEVLDQDMGPGDIADTVEAAAFVVKDSAGQPMSFRFGN